MELGSVADLFANLTQWFESLPSWAQIGAALGVVATVAANVTKVVNAVKAIQPLRIKLMGRNRRLAASKHRKNLRTLRLGLGVQQAQALFSAPPDVADVHGGSGTLIWYGRFSDVTLSVEGSRVASYSVTAIEASAGITWPDLGVELEDSPVGQHTFADLLPHAERRVFNATPQRISYSEAPAWALANGPTTWWLWYNDLSRTVGRASVPLVNGHYVYWLPENDNNSESKSAFEVVRNAAKPNSVVVHYADAPGSDTPPDFLSQATQQALMIANRSSF